MFNPSQLAILSTHICTYPSQLRVQADISPGTLIWLDYPTDKQTPKNTITMITIFALALASRN
jgi:hypothetical protein